MFHVGLDVHSNRSSLEILDDHGKLFKRMEVVGPWPKLLERIDALPRPMSVCFEASCGYGYLHDELSKRAVRVAVAHPGQLRLIFRSKRKNDRVDASKLAKLLFLDAVPTVHVPGVDVRSWRKLIVTRHSLVVRRVSCKNRVRALLRGAGVPTAGRSLWTKQARAWLHSLALSPGDHLALVVELSSLDQLSGLIRRVEKELNQFGRSHPGVGLLQSIPGVGPRTAEALAAWIDDVRRFRRVRCIGSYFGLVPCQDASGGRNRLGHITRDGPAVVRKLLCEAAHQAIRHSGFVRAWFERVMRGDRDRRKIAVVAVAHYLARVAATMLRTGESWRHEDKWGRPRSPASDGQGVLPPGRHRSEPALSSDDVSQDDG